MAANLADLTNIAKKFYGKYATALVGEYNEGVSELFESDAMTHQTGEDKIRWIQLSKYPGSFGPMKEASTILGSNGNQSVQSVDWTKIEAGIVDAGGQVEFTFKFVKLARSGRIMVNPFLELLRKHLMWIGRYDAWTTVFGASGFACRVGTGTKTNVTGNVWRIPIDTEVSSGSYRYAPSAWRILPGTHVQLVHNSTHAVLNDGGGNDYDGVVVAVSGTTIDIEWNQAMASTNTHVTTDYVVRFQQESGTLHKYGLIDFIGDANSTYVNELGSGTNAFPYGSTETGLDPDTRPEWSSIIEPYGGTFKITKLDNVLEESERRWGRPIRDNMALVCGPDVETRLIQEQRPDKRYQPKDPNDQMAGRRKVYDNGELIYCVSMMAKGRLDGVNKAVLSYDTYQKEGPGWVQEPDKKGNLNGAIFKRAERQRKFIGQTEWLGQRMSLERTHFSIRNDGS